MYNYEKSYQVWTVFFNLNIFSKIFNFHVQLYVHTFRDIKFLHDQIKSSQIWVTLAKYFAYDMTFSLVDTHTHSQYEYYACSVRFANSHYLRFSEFFYPCSWTQFKYTTRYHTKYTAVHKSTWLVSIRSAIRVEAPPVSSHSYRVNWTLSTISFNHHHHHHVIAEWFHCSFRPQFTYVLI